MTGCSSSRSTTPATSSPTALQASASSPPSETFTDSVPTLLLIARSARTHSIEICVSDEEHSLAEGAAAALGLTLTEFFRQAAQARAEEMLSGRSRDRSR
ncbi:MAG: DUF1778 domain-containing protein [Solirubrobacteraceae bacterium]